MQMELHMWTQQAYGNQQTAQSSGGFVAVRMFDAVAVATLLL